jgi:hypothetical protein
MGINVDSFALHFVQTSVPSSIFIDFRCLVINLDNAACSFLFNVFSDLQCSFVLKYNKKAKMHINEFVNHYFYILVLE